MKKLIVARHGEYDSHKQLCDFGRKQIKLLCEKLSAHVNGCPVRILSSTADRARQSAEIIAETFGSQIELHDVLWSGGDGKVGGFPEDFANVMELINDPLKQADIVVLMTHYEYIEDFPAFFGKRVLGTCFPQEVIPNGTAWLIDCEAKTISHIG